MRTTTPDALAARERTPRPRPVGWGGFSVWVLVTAVGTVLVSGSQIANYLYYGIQPLTMIALAVLQWLVLRRWIPKVGWWAPVTLAAWMAGPAIGFTAAEIVSELAGMTLRAVSGIERLPVLLTTLIAYALVGVVVGASQWLVLRRSLPKARWWIAALAVAWGFGELAAAGGAELVDGLHETTGPELWYAGYWGTNALLHALVTGAALVWITRGTAPGPVTGRTAGTPAA